MDTEFSVTMNTRQRLAELRREAEDSRRFKPVNRVLQKNRGPILGLIRILVMFLSR